MANKIVSLTALAASVLFAAPAQAQWQSFTPNNNGVEFWDNSSSDGAKCNIGYVVTGEAGKPENFCDNQRPLNWLPYNGSPMTNFLNSPTFFINGGSLTINVAKGAGGDIAGQDREWGFWTAVGGNLATKTFTNVNTVASFPANYLFGAGEMWGFYVKTTDDVIRTSDVDAQFALFQGANNQYVVGIEDINVLTGGDRDYQDMIASVTFTGQVPEPTSFALVGAGLAAMFAARRRRRA